MACEYCLRGEYPEDFRYCPKCGEYLHISNALDEFKRMGKEIEKALLASIPKDYQPPHLIRDENGKLIVFEREDA